MTLRTRLGLTMLLTAIPLVAGLAWLRGDMERRSAEDRLREVASLHMDRRGWSDYAYDPSRFGGHLETRRAPPHRRSRGEKRRPGGRRDGARRPFPREERRPAMGADSRGPGPDGAPEQRSQPRRWSCWCPL